MPLINEKLKLITCSEFRVFLKKLIKDKIEKEWSTDFIDNMNLIMIPRMTIKRRYENKGKSSPIMENKEFFYAVEISRRSTNSC